MVYRAVGNRCAVIFEYLNLPISNNDAIAILNRSGFQILEIDIIMLTRQCVINSTYRRGAKPSEAPAIVDCSSFIKWLYAQRGIWLPRRSIQQRSLGEIVKLDELISGDVVFISGKIDYFHSDPADGVGHVGIVINNRTVVHAANKDVGVIETPLEEFISSTNFRGARRYIPKEMKVYTFQTPAEREVEIADDIRWIILQSLP